MNLWKKARNRSRLSWFNFSSLSGYDIRESVKLWQRMSKKNKGKELPAFLSTHPSSKKRIENLEN